MAKFRPQRGGLTESLAEIKQVNSIQELRELLNTVKSIEIRPYVYDARICWDSHLVLVDGEPVGFTDGPLT